MPNKVQLPNDLVIIILKIEKRQAIKKIQYTC